MKNLTNTMRQMSSFLVLWFGEIVSAVGSGLTSFALGVWVYQETGSVTQFSIIQFAAVTPAVVFSPIAGVVADRWKRKNVLILCHLIQVAATLGALAVYLTTTLQVWHIIIVVTINSLVTSFQWPAFSSSVTLLVPKNQLGRANGMLQLGFALSTISAPAVAGFLVMTLGLGFILALDLGTFLCALVTVVITKIPDPVQQIRTIAEGKLLAPLREALLYLKERSGLLYLLWYFAVLNFSISVAVALLTPFVLNQASSAVLGTIMSIGGVGMLVGSVLMSIWGGPVRKRVPLMITCGLVVGGVIALAGLRTTILVLGSAAFCLMFVTPVINTTSQVIWQTKVAPDLQGRIFALRNAVATAAMPIAYVITGVFVDDFFEPAMREGGSMARTLGWMFGVGEGRGMGVLAFFVGLLAVVVSVLALCYPRLRDLDSTVKDAD